MTMTREQAIENACGIIGLAYTAMPGSTASDCFCNRGVAAQHPEYWNYENQGEAIKYVLAAVCEKLERDGKTLPKANYDLVVRTLNQSGVVL